MRRLEVAHLDGSSRQLYATVRYVDANAGIWFVHARRSLRPPWTKTDWLACPLFGVLQARPVHVDRRHDMVLVVTWARCSCRVLCRSPDRSLTCAEIKVKARCCRVTPLAGARDVVADMHLDSGRRQERPEQPGILVHLRADPETAASAIGSASRPRRGPRRWDRGCRLPRQPGPREEAPFETGPTSTRLEPVSRSWLARGSSSAVFRPEPVRCRARTRRSCAGTRRTLPPRRCFRSRDQ